MYVLFTDFYDRTGICSSVWFLDLFKKANSQAFLKGCTVSRNPNHALHKIHGLSTPRHEVDVSLKAMILLLMIVHPLYNGVVPAGPGDTSAPMLVPRAPLACRPAKHLQVAQASRRETDETVPPVPPLPRPLERCQVSTGCCAGRATIQVGRTPTPTQPLQHAQASSLTGEEPDAGIQRAPLLAYGPFQHFEVPDFGRDFWNSPSRKGKNVGHAAVLVVAAFSGRTLAVPSELCGRRFKPEQISRGRGHEEYVAAVDGGVRVHLICCRHYSSCFLLCRGRQPKLVVI